jgi:hypothetical protein
MELRNRIKLLSARSTPISEPGRDIENKLEQIREIMPLVLAGRLEYADTVRDYIGELREAYHGNNNRSVSNSIAKGVADKAEALFEEVIVAGSKRMRHTRKRKARKNIKTRRR